MREGFQLPFWKKKAASEGEKSALSAVEALTLRVTQLEANLSAIAMDWDAYKKSMSQQWDDTFDKLRAQVGRAAAQYRRLNDATEAHEQAQEAQAVPQQVPLHQDPGQLSGAERTALRRAIAGM